MISEADMPKNDAMQDVEVPIQILSTEVDPGEQEENNGISYIVSFD